MKGPRKKPLDSHTLSCWRIFANEILSGETRIRIWRDHEKWRSELNRIFGGVSTAIKSGYYRKRNSHISINLYCGETQHIEEVFETYLHELGHGYLRLEGKPTVGWEAEWDTNIWSLANFGRQMTALANAIHVLKWERPASLPTDHRASKKETSDLTGKYGNRAILRAGSIATLEAWVAGLVSRADKILAWHDKAIQNRKKSR